MRWKFAVCEDDVYFRQHLCAMIRRWVDLKNREGEEIELDLAVFDTTDKLLAVVDVNAFDAYLLDIETPSSLSGLDLARAIREYTVEAPLVFVTSHGEFAHRGYDYSALNYLIKPVDEATLFPVLQRVYAALMQQKGEEFICKISGEMRHFRYRDLRCFHSEAHYIVINNDPFFRFRGKIAELATELPSNFLRVHQSYIVNLEYMALLKSDSITLRDVMKTTVPVSEAYRAEVRQAYHRFYSNYHG